MGASAIGIGCPRLVISEVSAAGPSVRIRLVCYAAAQRRQAGPGRKLRGRRAERAAHIGFDLCHVATLQIGGEHLCPVRQEHLFERRGQVAEFIHVDIAQAVGPCHAASELALRP